MKTKYLKLFVIFTVLLIIFLALVFRGRISPNSEDKSLLDPNYSFSTPFQITTSGENINSLSLILGIDNKFYLAWSETTNGISNLWMSDSGDGKKWSTPWPVTNTSENDLYPSLIQGEDGIFYIAWQRNDLNAANKLNIWYGYSFDAKSWNTMQQVTNSNSNDITPSILLDDNNRNVLVWSSDRSGNFDLYISFLDPIGWREPINITNHSSSDTNPQLYKNPGSEYGLVWNRNQPGSSLNQGLFSISADGITWSISTPLSSSETTDVSNPSIFPCGTGYCSSWSAKSLDSYSEIFFSNLSNPLGVHEATGFVNRNDSNPQIAQTPHENIWLLIWLGGNENEVLYGRFIEFED